MRFETLAEAARFREKKLSEMVKAGKRIEEKLIGPQAEPQKILPVDPSAPPEICLRNRA